VVCLLALLGWQRPACALDIYTIDTKSGKEDYGDSHVQRLLLAVLEASSGKYGPYQLRTSLLRMERDRLMLEMQQGREVNLSVQVTSTLWEQQLAVVRIPVDKGISGYRIALIDGRRQAEFSALRTLEQLKAMPMGAGRQWSSTVVFARSGFDVVQGNSSAGLHSMLAAHRFDYFPRAIDEAIFEQAAYVRQFPTLAVERSMAIYMPLPRYFFVGGSDRQRLAERLEYGLQALIVNGRYDQIFHEFYDGLIDRTGLRKRRVFRLDNPSLPSQTPLANKAYWYDPFERR